MERYLDVEWAGFGGDIVYIPYFFLRLLRELLTEWNVL